MDEESESNLHNFAVIGLYLLLVLLGGLAAYFMWININENILAHFIDYALFALVFFVGMDLGTSKNDL